MSPRNLKLAGKMGCAIPFDGESFAGGAGGRCSPSLDPIRAAGLIPELLTSWNLGCWVETHLDPLRKRHPPSRSAEKSLGAADTSVCATSWLKSISPTIRNPRPTPGVLIQRGRAGEHRLPHLWAHCKFHDLRSSETTASGTHSGERTTDENQLYTDLTLRGSPGLTPVSKGLQWFEIGSNSRRVAEA
jgi:hypothetical protein